MLKNGYTVPISQCGDVFLYASFVILSNKPLKFEPTKTKDIGG